MANQIKVLNITNTDVVKVFLYDACVKMYIYMCVFFGVLYYILDSRESLSINNTFTTPVPI